MAKAETGKVLASLDVGTNSTLFLLAEVDRRGRIRPLQHGVKTNDLGRGLGADGELNPETIELNMDILRHFRTIADENGAVEIRIAATEALRRAGNAAVLLNRTKSELGLDIRIITGQEEARLTFLGILSGLLDPDKRIIAADVGGGSSEIICGEKGQILSAESRPVGAVSLDKKHIKHDPPHPEEIEAVRSEVDRVFCVVPDVFLNESVDLTICGGTASSLAAADLGLSAYQPERISGHILTRERLDAFIRQFTEFTLEERRRIPGIGWRRAEIILPGTIIIHGLLRALGRSQYITSERGLRYGILVQWPPIA